MSTSKRGFWLTISLCILILPALAFGWSVRPRDLAGGKDLTPGSNVAVSSNGLEFIDGTAGGADAETIQGIPITAPAIGDVGKYIEVGSGATAFIYGTPAGGGDMTITVWDGDANGFIDLDAGGTNSSLADPGADRIMFWDDSGTVVNWLSLGTGLSITTTTLNLDADLVALSGVTSAANAIPYFTGSGTADVITSSANMVSLLGSADYATARTNLGLAIGTNVQAYDAELAAIAGLTFADASIIQLTGAAAAAVLTSGGNNYFLTSTSDNSAIEFKTPAAALTAIGAQGLDTDLTALAAITVTRGDLIIGSSTPAWVELAIGAANTVLTTNGTDPAWSTVTSAMITDETITASDLAATLTFGATDSIDISGVTTVAGQDYGLALPKWADLVPATDKPWIFYDAASNAIKIYDGGWISIAAGTGGGAPTDSKYWVSAADGTLSAEVNLGLLTTGLVYSTVAASTSTPSIVTEGLAIDLTSSSIAFDPTELTGNRTWSDGSGATAAWTVDLSGTTDPVVTFGDNYVNVSTGILQQGGNAVYYASGTDVAVADGGTNKSSWTQYAIPYLSTTTAFSEIAVGTAGQYLIVNSGATGYQWTAALTMDTITDGSSYQKVAAADVDASGHVTSIMTPTGGAISFTGPGDTRVITLDDAAQELAARNRANTFTLTNTFNGDVVAGNADTDTVTIRSLLVGGNSRALWLASTAPSPTYATGTTEFYVQGDIEVGGTVYSAGGFTSTGTGDSYVSLANNTTYTPSSGYLLYFEGGALKVYDGTEKNLLDTASAPTLTGATWSFASVTNFVLPHGNSATADATGEIAFDDDDDRFIFQIGSTQRYFDFTGDTLNYVLKSNGSGAFTLQADETGTTPYWSTVGNPTADVTIAHDAGEETNFTFTGNYTTGSQFLIQQLTGNPSGGTLFEVRAADSDTGVAKFGDGTNAILVSQAGALTLAGTASITAGGIILGDSSPDASGEIGYASNAFNLYANSEDMVWTAGTDTWTYSSNTGANLVLGNPSATNINVTSGVTVGTILYPDANDGAALGTATVSWSDLFLASGALINFNNSDVTLTHSANTLAFAGASTGYTFDSGVTVTGNINATTMSATTFTGALTGNASSATLAATSTIVDSTDATSYVVIVDSDTGSLALKTDSGVTYSATTGMLYATGFTGPLTGNASTATLAATSTVVDSTDATSYILIADDATGSLAIKTDSGVTYSATTGMLYATGFTGPLTGNASTATTASAVTNATLTTALTVNTGAVTLSGNASGSTLALAAGTTTLSGTTEYVLTAQGAGVAPIWKVLAGGGDLKADGTVAMTGVLVPGAANTLALGSGTSEFADLYLGDSAVIYGQNDQSATLTSSASTWTANNFAVTGDLVVTGRASGGAKTYSVASGVTNATQLSDVTGVSTLIAAEVNGTIINIDDSGVTRFTLPTPASGYNTVFAIGVSGVTVQVESGTTMYVDGTATATGGVGAQIVSATVGELITCLTANVPGAGEIEWMCRKTTD